MGGYYKKKNFERKHVNIICLCLMTICVAGAIFCLAKLLPMYANYEYETSLNTLDLPKVTVPTDISITIAYENNPPTDIKIINTNLKGSWDCTVTPDDKKKQLYVLFSTDIPSENYKLQLMPQDNYELGYIVRSEPSKDYIVATVDIFNRSINHGPEQYMLKVDASYKYNNPI